jgi:hypothetical protein
LRGDDKDTRASRVNESNTSSTKSSRMSRRAKEVLTLKIAHLKEYLRQLNEQAKPLRENIEKAPTREINHGGVRRVLRMSDPAVCRMLEDTERQISLCTLEIREAEVLLSPPRGRPPEAIYRQALRDLEAQPNLTTRQLAVKYLPHYFPDRAEWALNMMKEGLRRARRRTQSLAK